MSARNHSERNNHSKNLLFGGTLLLFLTGFFGALIAFRSNALWADDLDIVRILQQTVATPTVFEKIKLLFAQHNVHRVLTTRSIFLLLQETVGFRPMYAMYIGDAFYLSILYVFYKLFKTQTKLHNVYFIPVIILLLSVVNIENATWAMASIQNIAVLFFVVLAIYQLTVSRRWQWAAVWAVAASLTSLTGFLTWGLIVAYLLYYRRFKELFYVIGVAAITYFLYKLGMEKAIEQDYLRLFTSLPENIWYLLVFVGQVFLVKEPVINFHGYYLESIGLIAFTATTLLFLTYKLLRYIFQRTQFQPIQESTFLYFFFLIICGVMSLVVTLETGNNFFKKSGIGIPDRYVIHSLLFFCLFYMMVIVSVRQRKVALVTSIFTALILNIGHLYASADVHFRQKSAAKLDYFYLKNHGKFYSFLKQQGYYIHCTDCLKNIYAPLEAEGAKLFPADGYRTSFDEVLSYPKKSLKNPLEFLNEDFYYYKGLIIKLPSATEFVLLRNAGNTYVLPSYRLRNSSRSVLKTGQYLQDQRLASIYMNKMKPGVYNVFLFNETAEKSLTTTGYSVEILSDNEFAVVDERTRIKE